MFVVLVAFGKRNIFYLQLYVVVSKHVVFNGIGNVKAAFRLDIACRGTLPKGNAVYHIARFRVDKFELDVFLLAPHHLTGAIIVNIVGAKARFKVARTEGRELF